MFETILAEFLGYLMISKDYSPNTIPKYKSQLLLFFEWGNINDLSQITPNLCEDYQVYRIQERGLTVTANFNFVIALRAFLKFTNKRKGTNYQLDMFEVPRRKRNQNRSFATEDDVNALIDVTHRERDRLIILLAFTSGARRAELAQFTVESFRGNSFTPIVKGGDQEVYYFDETLAERLRVYMAMERITSGHVFRSTTGKPVQPHTIARIIKGAAQRAGITKKFSAHTMRHGFGTALLEAGADIRSVQAVMHHDSIQTTQIYTHVTDRRKRETVQRYGPKIVDNHPINIENLERLYRPLA